MRLNFVQVTRIYDFQSVAADCFRVLKKTYLKCKGSEHHFATILKPTRRANKKETAEYTREDSISETANYANTDCVKIDAFLSILLHMVLIA